MQYTRGKAGHESRHDFEIVTVNIDTGKTAALAKGEAIVSLKSGPRGVKFMAQGKHCNDLADRLVPGNVFTATVRWTGRDAVTITKVAHLQPDLGTATTSTNNRAAAEALFYKAA